MLSTLSAQKLIFVDLDLTLFDYTIARKNASIAALQELRLDSPEKSYELYSEIAEHWRAFLMLGFPNLRRQWNDQSIYLLMIVLLTAYTNSQREIFFEFLDKLEAYQDINQVNALNAENSEAVDYFLNAYSEAKANRETQEKVHRAYHTFENETATLRPFPFARNLLSAFLSKKNYHSFVVTEGDWEIQWAKVQKLGFSDLINVDNFLVTDGLAKPRQLLALFDETRNTLSNADNFRDPSIQLKLEAIDYLEQQFELFNSKQLKHFYGHAIHIAVKQIIGEYSDTEFPNVTNEEWRSLPKIKLATLGDRYFNDIKPLLDIFGSKKLLSIRMLYGKYSSEKPTSQSEIPDFTVEELDVALALLLGDENWITKLPIPRPNHFYLDNTTAETLMWHACIALTLPRPVYSMAEAILEDFGYSDTKIHNIKHEFIMKMSTSGSGNNLEKELRTILKSTK